MRWSSCLVWANAVLALVIGTAPRTFAQQAKGNPGQQPQRGRGTPLPADQPLARTDQNSQTAHQQLLEKTKKGRIDVYFVGDSITRRWGATDYPDFLANWKQNFQGWNAANIGWGAET